MSTIPNELKDLWLSNSLPELFLDHLKLQGDPDSAVNSSFRLGFAAQIAIGLSGLSAAYLHFLREGIEQDVTVDARHAVLAFHSEAWYTINDAPPEGDSWDRIAGLYRTKDQGWVRIHTNFPHGLQANAVLSHRKGVLEILGIPERPSNPASRSQVADAILTRNATELEDECARKGMCVTALRSHSEWMSHPQAQALGGVPPVQIIKLKHRPPQIQGHTGPSNKRPLAGIKVLDLSRVLAGPIAGRTLAAHGADVLLITSPNLPSLPLLDVETSLGKRTAQLDLSNADDKDKLKMLTKEAKVFLQAYRPGGMEEKGFGADDILKLKMQGSGDELGMVFANLRAWGWDGPWRGRRGFDSLVQTATGFNADEGMAYQRWQSQLSTKAEVNEWVPKPLPMQALDHAAAYFLTFGINVALCRMLTEGGSYEVRVSLASVGQWIRSLGRLNPHQAFSLGKPLPTNRNDEEIQALTTIWQERNGLTEPPGNANRATRKRKMRTMTHAAILEKTPVREGILADEPGKGEERKGDEDWGAPMRLDADSSDAILQLWTGSFSSES